LIFNIIKADQKKVNDKLMMNVVIKHVQLQMSSLLIAEAGYWDHFSGTGKS